MASQGLKSDFEDQSWLHVARRAYRFAEHPIGCLSTKGEVLSVLLHDSFAAGFMGGAVMVDVVWGIS
jgi:hypothetical protein